jgi:hypothetical protein
MPTYYVDGAVGNDANAGTSEGAGNAWATIDHAHNNVIAGDTVYVKAGTYNELVTIDTAGSSTALISIIGYTTTPGDNGKATIDGTTNCLVASAGAKNYLYQNIIFTAASSHGVSGSNADVIHFVNCDFTSNGGVGAYLDDSCILLNCTFANNTGYGLLAGNFTSVAGCIAYGNTSGQISGSGYAFYKNVCYSPGTLDVVYWAGSYLFAGNTIDGENTRNCAASSSALRGLVIDNIFYDGINGFDYNATTLDSYHMNGYNLVNSNTTDYNNPPLFSGYQDVTGAPAFTDEAGDDYTLGEFSPAVGAGIVPGGIT